MEKQTKIKNLHADDKQIVQMYWERNERAIQETDYKYGRFILRIANNILNDEFECEECQNDTYLCIWNSIPPNKPNIFSAFISKIVRSIAINRYKEKTRKKRIPSEMTISIEELQDSLKIETLPHEESFENDLVKIINNYLRGLSDRQQFIFIGRFYMCDKLEIIANELNVNVSTVHREIEKIKLGLKQHLERNEIYV